MNSAAATEPSEENAGGMTIEEVQAAVRDSNINPQTLLATDYLNHFNEIIMMVEMLPDIPDILEDAMEWHPKTYIEHFEGSSIKDARLAIIAYDFAEPRFREALELTIGHMNNTVKGGLDQLMEPVEAGDTNEIKRISGETSQRLKIFISMTNSIIQGTASTMGQNEIDAMLTSGGSLG